MVRFKFLANRLDLRLARSSIAIKRPWIHVLSDSEPKSSRDPSSRERISEIVPQVLAFINLGITRSTTHYILLVVVVHTFKLPHDHDDGPGVAHATYKFGPHVLL